MAGNHRDETPFRKQSTRTTQHSLIVGSSPENKYAVDLKCSYTYCLVKTRKILEVATAGLCGSTMPRPIYVQQSDKTNLFYINGAQQGRRCQTPNNPNKETFEHFIVNDEPWAMTSTYGFSSSMSHLQRIFVHY